MNQSGTNQGTASSQNTDDKKDLATGEFVYEFFQPVFESSLDYQFTTGSSNTVAAEALTSCLSGDLNEEFFSAIFDL